MRFGDPMFVSIVVIAIALASCTGVHSVRYPSIDRLPAGIFLESESYPPLEFERSAPQLSAISLKLTQMSEGFRSHLYNDAVGFCTIGYGHLVKKAACDGTESSNLKRGLSHGEGVDLLSRDMDVVREAVTSVVDVQMSEGQFGSLCDFVYNVGIANFSRSTLLRAINSTHYERVPTQFRRWVIADGKRLEGLKLRREREIRLFFEGLPIPVVPEEQATPPIDIRRGEEDTP
jgi:lysozyme